MKWTENYLEQNLFMYFLSKLKYHVVFVMKTTLILILCIIYTKISIKKDRKGKDTNRWQLCSAQDIPLLFGFLRHKSQFWKNLVKITSLDNIIIIVITWNIKCNEISNLILMVRFSNYFLYKSLPCWNPGHLDSCVIIVIHLHVK